MQNTISTSPVVSIIFIFVVLAGIVVYIVVRNRQQDDAELVPGRMPRARRAFLNRAYRYYYLMAALTGLLLASHVALFLLGNGWTLPLAGTIFAIVVPGGLWAVGFFVKRRDGRSAR